MTQAKSGDTVKVHYTGRLEDGTVFDSSEDREPLEFKIGGGKVIPGFDKGIIGMECGAKKTIEIPPEEAYGQRRDDLVAVLKKSELPEDIPLNVGQHLQSKHRNGSIINLVITDVAEDTITVDANPPLAGKTLIFDLELKSIVKGDGSV